MKKIILQAFVTVISSAAFSQQTIYYSDPQSKFKEAKEYFQKEQFSLAYPIFRELRQSLRETAEYHSVVDALCHGFCRASLRLKLLL